jgi:hypothetical protein
MKRTATLLGIGLLVLMMTGSAFAANPSSLKGTTWNGLLTIVRSSDEGNVTTTSDNATIVFTGEDGDYLVGTMHIKGLPPESDVTFTCIREGKVLLMTAKGYLMSGMIVPGHPVKKGARPPLNLVIQGRNVDDGSMFEGVLIKKP